MGKRTIRALILFLLFILFAFFFYLNYKDSKIFKTDDEFPFVMELISVKIIILSVKKVD